MRENSVVQKAVADRAQIVTGGTGFVGSALILELLQETKGPIIAIVRPKTGQTPTERLRCTLHELISGYGLPRSLRVDVAVRVTAIAGDIEQPGCGVETEAVRIPHGAEFWHCAASLQYQDRHREKIERTNVLGTANVVSLAKAAECSMFNMVSTAYVAGNRRGVIYPEVPNFAFVNNCYERSKIGAEQEVVASGLKVRILRPSVVVGHSRTHHSLSVDGFYGFIRNLTRFRNALERTQAGLASSLDVSIVVDPDGMIDLVPIDSVVADAVALSNIAAPPGYYHLTNSTPPVIADAVRTCFELAGLASPRLVRDRSELNSVDLKLQARIDFYSSYMINAKQFDRTSVRAILGDATRDGTDLSNGQLHRLGGRYLDQLEGSAPRVAVSL